MVEELPTPVQAESMPVTAASCDERASLTEGTLRSIVRPLYELLCVDQPRHLDELVELSGLTSSEVLPARFDLELKNVVRQLPGKQFLKVLL